MNLALKRILSQTLSDVMPWADLRRITLETDPTSARATMLRVIAQDILAATRPAKRIAVIPIGNDNFSWLIANVAYALAETRNSVCLVEADFRTPRLADVFDLKSTGGGLADILQSSGKSNGARYQINPYLTILPGGDFNGDVVGLISSHDLDVVLGGIADIYCLTLVICPPSADHLDYSFISRSCEGAVVVARQDGCKMADVTTVRSELDKLSVPVLYALMARRST